MPTESIWSTVRGQFLWRPILLFSHILLIALVSQGSRDDRLWNTRVKSGMHSFTPIKNIYNCSFYGYSECCDENNLAALSNLYRGAQKEYRNLKFIDLLLYISTMTVVICLCSYILEWALLGKLESKNWWHRFINKMSTVSYIICLFLLSHGLIDMIPRDPNQSELCGEFNNRQIPHSVKVMSNCYLKLGACRNRDTMSLVLIFMIGYPIMCFCCYLLAGTLSCMFETQPFRKNQYRNPNKLRMTQDPELQEGRVIKTVPETTSTTPINMNTINTSNSRVELGYLLRLLENDASVRRNENYLTGLARSFKNYVRSGNTPKIVYKQESNCLTTTIDLETMTMSGTTGSIAFDYAPNDDSNKLHPLNSVPPKH